MSDWPHLIELVKLSNWHTCQGKWTFACVSACSSLAFNRYQGQWQIFVVLLNEWVGFSKALSYMMLNEHLECLHSSSNQPCDHVIKLRLLRRCGAVRRPDGVTGPRPPSFCQKTWAWTGGGSGLQNDPFDLLEIPSWMESWLSICFDICHAVEEYRVMNSSSY